MFHTRMNNFPVFRGYRDIDFALRCMDVLATNLSELKFDVKFCEVKAEGFISDIPHFIGITLE